MYSRPSYVSYPDLEYQLLQLETTNRERVDSVSMHKSDLPQEAISVDGQANVTNSGMDSDFCAAGILAQCRGEDVQICDDTVSALGQHVTTQPDIHFGQAPIDALKEIPVPSLHMLAPLGESLEVYQWDPTEEANAEDDDEEMSDEEDEDSWVDEDMAESEEQGEDEGEGEDIDQDEDSDHFDEFRGHGGHDLGGCLDTPPTNDKEGIAAMLRLSQEESHIRSTIADKGYLLQIGLLPHPIMEKPGYVSRILRVPGRITFEKLSEAINLAFGWSGLHAYEFRLCKPCRKRRRCMCTLCEPVVARFNQTIEGQSYVDTWYEQFYTNFDADKVILSDVWRYDTCRGMNMWYRYDFGDDWTHLIHFLGEADGRLGAAMALPRKQEIWCLSGEGHAWPEDMREDWTEWKEHTNLYEWDREDVNKNLGKLKI